MATLVLGVAGAGLGSVFGGVGAILGRAAGALAGYALDSALFGSSRSATGPRLSDLEVQSSTEGAVMPRLYGRARLAGQMIWATDFEEVKNTEDVGGKGGPTITTTEFTYFANFALGLCEGPIARIGRIWADGRIVDQSAFNFRLYRGTEDQLADSLIVAKEGEAPAYRGTAYVVFERMPLADFGNRIPQLSFEVFRPVPGIEDFVRAVCVIPGSTEFGYDTEPVTRSVGEGAHEAENVHVLRDVSDWTVSIDELQALCPQLEWVTLVVAWFGDDLRAGSCTIRPKVDESSKSTRGATWRVSGLTRAEAEAVSQIEGRAAYGGSPSAADRQAQLRTPITDGAAAKPWAFRFKDIEAWWSNSHFDRPGGTEVLLPTDWVPRSKPIWFTELGCPAVDKGANQPNVFFDPKSDQSALPYFSNGSRDDLAQRSYIDAYQRFFDSQHPNFDGSNPISPSYGGRMIDPAHLHLWAWDARPYPYFPECTDVWADGPNWQLGHWLNGRLGSVTLAALIEAVLADHAFDDYAISDVHGLVGGYVVNEVLSARATLEPVLQAFRTDAADAGDKVLFRGRNRPGDLAVAPAALVEPPEEANLTRSRAQETELASEIVLRVIDPGKDYRMAAASSRRLVGQSRRSVTLDLTAVLEFAEAERLTDRLLRDIWTGRERVELRLPPSGLGVEAGDLLSLTGGTRPEFLLAERIEDGQSRKLQLRRVDEASAPPPLKKPRRNPPATAPAWGPPAVRIVDFAPPDGSETHAPRMAVFAEPWPGTVAVYSGAAGGGFRLATTLSAPATLGRLDSALAPGPLGVFDQVNTIEVTLFGGALAGLPDIDVFSGGNGAAVQTTGGAWEVLQFAHAELIGERRYRLTRLLRGQCGTEQAMAAGAATGAEFVLLNGAVAALPVAPEQLGLPLRYRFGPARDSHAAPTFAELTIAAAGLGLKPFAPVQLRARRDGSGNIELAWIRRTRFGGVGWELSEVPLNEEREAYRLDILDGAALKRRVEPTSPAHVYSAADQVADFGGPAPAFTARVAQLSATFGPGYALQEIVNV